MNPKMATQSGGRPSTSPVPCSRALTNKPPIEKSGRHPHQIGKHRPADAADKEHNGVIKAAERGTKAPR
jgi:hypothetical protein